tara:strand:- start:33 stop:236 length:204 start_codon:yes stop_codon:yes gene_type:complete
MSVDGKEHWLENRAIELFEEIQRKNPHLSWKEIDELCYKQAEKDYENMQDMPNEISLYPDSLSGEEE